MPRRNGEKVVLESGQALDRFKWEVAENLGLAEKVRQVGWENMTTREVGKIGGQMVKQMIAAAEESLRQEDQAPSPPREDLAQRIYQSPDVTEGLVDVQSQAAQNTRSPAFNERRQGDRPAT